MKTDTSAAASASPAPAPVDLSTPHPGHLPARVTTAVHALLCAAPGVVMNDLVRTLPPAPGGSASTASVLTTLSFTGWSPTLHEVIVTLALDVGVDPDDPGYVDALLAALEPVANRQRERAAAGLAHGLARPLYVPSTVSGARRQPEIEKRHLHVDESLVRVARDRGYDLRKLIDEALAQLHDFADSYDGGSRLAGAVDHVAEIASDDPARPFRVIGSQVTIHAEPGLSITYDGHVLEMNGRALSDVAATAAVGRRLGEIVAVHQALDDRIVAYAETIHVDGWPLLRIALEPRPMAIPEALAAADGNA